MIFYVESDVGEPTSYCVWDGYLNANVTGNVVWTASEYECVVLCEDDEDCVTVDYQYSSGYCWIGTADQELIHSDGSLSQSQDFIHYSTVLCNEQQQQQNAAV